jgi:Leucine-rich repeat (LRR) protein
LKNLKDLDLSNTEIDDSAAIHICQLTTLEYLNLDGTKIGDQFIAGISSLGNLTSLTVAGTRITNVSETAIESFSRLEEFYADETAMDYDTRDRIDRFTDANSEAAYERITKP